MSIKNILLREIYLWILQITVTKKFAYFEKILLKEQNVREERTLFSVKEQNFTAVLIAVFNIKSINFYSMHLEITLYIE